jgi:GxxExxY protein
MGHEILTEVGVTVYFRGNAIARQRIDMLVDGLVVVEIKSTHELQKTATRQLYNYLKATKLEVGLLLHFGTEPRFFRLVSSNKS